MEGRKVSDPAVFLGKGTLYIKNKGLTPGMFGVSIDTEGTVNNL